MRVQSWSHVGITVSDFNRAVRFYWDVFGCPLVGVSDAPPDPVRGFFGVPPSPQGAAGAPGPPAPEPTGKPGWHRIPGGAVIEVFHFQPQQSAQPVVWNRIGGTHI